MQKPNYQQELDKILNAIKPCTKPTLLLHACCAPCSSYVLEYLCRYFDITIFYYNPNIHPKEEYTRRLQELKTFLPKFTQNLKEKNGALSSITLVEEPYDPQEFFDAVKTEDHPELKTEPEKGERCRRCYEFRLKRAFEYATKNNFDWFTTTLSISPFKDSQKINQIGTALTQIQRENQNQQNASKDQQAATTTAPSNAIDPTTSKPGTTQPTKFLTSDFKKKGGFKRSLELSAEFGLYRQDYCGCIFSKQNMEKFHTKTQN